jgi:hypothetical protein
LFIENVPTPPKNGISGTKENEWGGSEKPGQNPIGKTLQSE